MIMPTSLSNGCDIEKKERMNSGGQTLMTTTIQINGSVDNKINNNNNNHRIRIESSPNLRQQHQHNRRSAFIPEEDDGKQFISKDESEDLRTSILRVNRPRISRPWFDQPPTTVAATTTDILVKKDNSNTSPNVVTSSTRSNSSSGCSSNPQSGPSSPVSSKCSSEGGSSSRGVGMEAPRQIAYPAKIGNNREEEEHQQNGNNNRSPHQMLSASLVQKAISNSSSSNSNKNNSYSSPIPPTSQTANKTTPSPIFQPTAMPLLKRKEFPSYQRQRIPMPQAKIVTAPAQRQLPQKRETQVQPMKLAPRRVDPAEEVEELSRAAQKQLDILEELEMEDRERKTRISSHLANRNGSFGGSSDEAASSSPAGSSSASSSRESTGTRRISSLSSTSTSSAASPRMAAHLQMQNNINNGIIGSARHCPSSTSMVSGTAINQAINQQQQKAPAKMREMARSSSSSQQKPTIIDDYIMVNDEPRRQQPQRQPLENSNSNTIPQLECKTCGQMITDVILQALGTSFHPTCFRCSKCGKCLDGVPFAVEQNGAVICMDDYERHFVPHCHSCKKAINAVNEFGQVVRVIIKDREYHIQCYCCEGCGMQLSNEEQNRCYPLADHLLCRRCHTLWKRVGALDTEAAISDL